MQFNPLTRSNEDLLLRRQFLSDQKSRVNFPGYIGRGGRVGRDISTDIETNIEFSVVNRCVLHAVRVTHKLYASEGGVDLSLPAPSKRSIVRFDYLRANYCALR